MKKREMLFLWGLVRDLSKQGKDFRNFSRQKSAIPNDPLLAWYHGVADGYKLAITALKMNLKLLKIGW